MFKRLFTLIFAIFLVTAHYSFGQDRNQLKKHILSHNKERVLDVVDTETYQAYSTSQKSKPTKLYNFCFSGTFNPVGIAKNQISKTGYDPKDTKYNKQLYKRQKPTEEDMESYIQDKKTAAPVSNTSITNQITAILAN